MWWRARADGVTVRIRVQPRARRAGLQGLVPGADGPRLKISVTEAPEDGRANRAVCAALARALGMPPSAAAVEQGGAAREKVVFVAGDPKALGKRLEALA
ncbi:MAG: DUF167 family protein [Paracraurococcus sp.]|jgi:uncharacterized protein